MTGVRETQWSEKSGLKQLRVSFLGGEEMRILIFFLTLFLPTGIFGANYDVVVFHLDGHDTTNPSAINDNGQVVGYSNWSNNVGQSGSTAWVYPPTKSYFSPSIFLEMQYEEGDITREEFERELEIQKKEWVEEGGEIDEEFLEDHLKKIESERGDNNQNESREETQKLRWRKGREKKENPQEKGIEG